MQVHCAGDKRPESNHKTWSACPEGRHWQTWSISGVTGVGGFCWVTKELRHRSAASRVPKPTVCRLSQP